MYVCACICVGDVFACLHGFHANHTSSILYHPSDSIKLSPSLSSVILLLPSPSPMPTESRVQSPKIVFSKWKFSHVTLLCFHAVRWCEAGLVLLQRKPLVQQLGYSSAQGFSHTYCLSITFIPQMDLSHIIRSYCMFKTS